MALWLARASSQLARRAAAGGRSALLQPRQYGDWLPWFLGSSTPAVLGPPAAGGGRRGLCSVRRFTGESSAAAAAAASSEDELENSFTDAGDQVVDFPGGKVSFEARMNFIPESKGERVSCYRVLGEDGRTISGSRFQEVSKEMALKMYREMATLQIMDTIFYEAQRQGRISFYLTSHGEEAINIASAAALSMDDIVLPQSENVVQGTGSPSMARLHAAGVCKPVLWKQVGLRQREANANSLRVEPPQLFHGLVTYCYTALPCCWSSLLSKDG